MSINDPVSREAGVTVRGGTSGVAQVVESRSHRLRADESVEVPVRLGADALRTVPSGIG